MWQLTKIPKIAHFYWGNKTMPFLRYMTIFSFYKMNPDWKLKLYIPITSSEKIISAPVVIPEGFKDYFDELRKIPTLSIEEVDFKEFNKFSEVHKSDLLRWTLLGSAGGVWEDMDLLNIKSMDSIVCNNERDKHNQVIFIRYNGVRIKPIGFLLSQANSLFYKFMESTSRNILTNSNLQNPYDNNKLDYQAIGTNIFSTYSTETYVKQNFNEDAIIINQECVYKYIWDQVGYLFSDNKSIDYISDPNAIGCHWFGGALLTQNYVTNVTLDNYKNYNNTISNLLSYVLSK